jgi:hypothetical protein
MGSLLNRLPLDDHFGSDRAVLTDQRGGLNLFVVIQCERDYNLVAPPAHVPLSIAFVRFLDSEA